MVQIFRDMFSRRTSSGASCFYRLKEPLMAATQFESFHNHLVSPSFNPNGCFTSPGIKMGRANTFKCSGFYSFRIPNYGKLGFNVKGCYENNRVSNRASEACVLHPRKISDDLRLRQKMDSRRGNSLVLPDDSSPGKLVLAVDVDEVLGNFVFVLNKFLAERYSVKHSFSEYHVYEFYKIWKCSFREADDRVHEFFKSRHFKFGIEPIPGARRALNKLSRFCKLTVVTSRQNVIKDHTIKWIEKNFPGLFEEIHFGNHFAREGESIPKSEMCKSLGAKVLIDDNPTYAIECAEAGIRVLLFDFKDAYPWCKTESVNQHPLVTKVRDWDQVEQKIMSWILT